MYLNVPLTAGSASQHQIKENTLNILPYFSYWFGTMTNQTLSDTPDYVIKSRWLLEGIFLPTVGIVGVIGKEGFKARK